MLNHHVRRGANVDDPIGAIETFYHLHTRDGQWKDDYTREVYGEMKRIREEQPFDPNDLDSLKDTDIMERVLGSRPRYIKGWWKIVNTVSSSTAARGSASTSQVADMSTSIDGMSEIPPQPVLWRMFCDLQAKLEMAKIDLGANGNLPSQPNSSPSSHQSNVRAFEAANNGDATPDGTPATLANEIV